MSSRPRAGSSLGAKGVPVSGVQLAPFGRKKRSPICCCKAAKFTLLAFVGMPVFFSIFNNVEISWFIQNEMLFPLATPSYELLKNCKALLHHVRFHSHLIGLIYPIFPKAVFRCIGERHLVVGKTTLEWKSQIDKWKSFLGAHIYFSLNSR